MNHHISQAVAAQYQKLHDEDEYKQRALDSSLKITVVGATSTEQKFIAQTVPAKHDLKFINFASVKAAIRSGALPRQGMVMFVVSAEHRLAMKQIRIMKWIMARQPDLNVVPLISKNSIWDAMRESLARSFPVYLPITFSDVTGDGPSSDFQYCTAQHFSKIFEALTGAMFDRKFAEKQVDKAEAYKHPKVADLRALKRPQSKRTGTKSAEASLVFTPA